MNFWGRFLSECKYFEIVESQKKKYVYLRESGGERTNIQIVYMENRLQYFPFEKKMVDHKIGRCTLYLYISRVQ